MLPRCATASASRECACWVLRVLQVGALGDLLGPIGITIGKDVNLEEVRH